MLSRTLLAWAWIPCLLVTPYGCGKNDAPNKPIEIEKSTQAPVIPNDPIPVKPGDSETPESPIKEMPPEVGKVVFDLKTKDDSVAYMIQGKRYFPSELSQPIELPGGSYELEVWRDGKPLFSSPFTVTAGKQSQVPFIDKHREAVLAIFGYGGKVTVDGDKHIDKLEDLPTTYFILTGINYYYHQELRPNHFKPVSDIQLQSIDISFSNATDEAILQIKDFSKLSKLGIGKTKITPAALNKIMADNPPLQHAVLFDLQIPDEFMNKLKDTPLWLFSGANSNLNDSHLESLSGKEYFLCHLDRTSITDDGLAILKGTKFRELGLEGNAITDKGLAHCHEFAKLEKIKLKDTKVTEAGIKKLKEKFPDLEVEK